MAVWTIYELGPRVRRLPRGGEERLGLDRRDGRPVTIRVYPDPAGSRAALGVPARVTAPADSQLAQPLEIRVEGHDAVVVRELSFGPSLGDLIGQGAQAESIVVAILRQLLAGLEALHAVGRAHLRLGPEAVRFDLLSGLLKVGDLEEALLSPEPDRALIPRYLEPDVRVGLGGPASDVYSVGRLGEALLRGGAPLAFGELPREIGRKPLWEFLRRCQAPLGAGDQGRPSTAGEALALMEGLGLSSAAGVSLPLAGFVRSQVRGLRQLRRWRAQSLPPPRSRPLAGPSAGYREVLSSGIAGRVWSGVALGAVASLAFALHLGGAPAQGRELAPSFTAAACRDEARSMVLGNGERAATGSGVLDLAMPPGSVLAIDGCPVPPSATGSLRLGLLQGRHALRASLGDRTLAQQLEVRTDGTTDFDLGAAPSPLPPESGALERLGQLLVKPTVSPTVPFDPIATAMIDPLAQQLLLADGALTRNGSESQAALTDELGLTLDGLAAAQRRFEAQAAPCAARLSAAVASRLTEDPAGAGRVQAQAAIFLTVARLRAPLLREPLRLEDRGLGLLHLTPGPRLLSAVAELSALPEIASCVNGLEAPAREIDELSAQALAQIPGAALPPNPEPEDDSTE